MRRLLSLFSFPIPKKCFSWERHPEREKFGGILEKLGRALAASYDLASSDIIYPIFDPEEDGITLVAVTVTKMSQKMLQSGQPPPKMVKNEVFPE